MNVPDRLWYIIGGALGLVGLAIICIPVCSIGLMVYATTKVVDCLGDILEG